MHATATYPYKANFKIGLTNQYLSAVPSVLMPFVDTPPDDSTQAHGRKKQRVV
jgi:hypothetical protein